MLEALRQIPGPVFLAYFAIFAAACIALGRLLIGADGTTSHPLPDDNRFDPIAIAALRGGWRQAVTTAVCELWSRDLLEITGEGRDTTIGSALSTRERLSPVAVEVLGFLGGRCQPYELLRNRELRERVDLRLEPVYREMEQARLARGAQERRLAWTIAAAMALVLAAVGGAKLYLGLTHHRPVTFLVALLGGSLVGLFVVLKPWSKATALGRLYLRTLSERVERTADTITGALSPALAVALLGLGSMPAAEAYGPVADAFSASKPVPDSDGGAGVDYDGGGSSGGGGRGGGCGGCGN